MPGSKKVPSNSAGQENDLKGNENCFELAGGLVVEGSRYGESTVLQSYDHDRQT